MVLYLGIDIGGTAARWVVRNQRAEVARGSAGGATGLLFDTATTAAFADVLADIRAALPGPVAFAHLGITGAGFDADPRVQAQVAVGLGLPAGRFTWSSDIMLAWNAAFAGERGHLVSAGTGSVGIAFDAAGEAIVVGGRGMLVDDGGSAGWIALRALDRVGRLMDDHGSPVGATMLAAELAQAMGGDGHEDLRRAVYGSKRGAIGRLALPVARAARAGDPLALTILAEAGDELARLARALLKRAGPAPVAFVGGVFDLHPAIRARIEQRLPEATVAFPRIDAAAHAALMALRAGD